MSVFTYAKPTPINWVMLVKMVEQKINHHCKFCDELIADGEEVLISTDFDGVTVFHVHHFNRQESVSP